MAFDWFFGNASIWGRSKAEICRSHILVSYGALLLWPVFSLHVFRVEAAQTFSEPRQHIDPIDLAIRAFLKISTFLCWHVLLCCSYRKVFLRITSEGRGCMAPLSKRDLHFSSIQWLSNLLSRCVAGGRFSHSAVSNLVSSNLVLGLPDQICLHCWPVNLFELGHLQRCLLTLNRDEKTIVPA